MHIAKCEGCEKEVEFETYKHDWPAGWMLTGISRWGKKYHRQSGWAWWCPKCDSQKAYMDELLDKLPIPAQRALGADGSTRKVKMSDLRIELVHDADETMIRITSLQLAADPEAEVGVVLVALGEVKTLVADLLSAAIEAVSAEVE